jgi:hypothetical protein
MFKLPASLINSGPSVTQVKFPSFVKKWKLFNKPSNNSSNTMNEKENNAIIKADAGTIIENKTPILND